jgi:hypothetical protein
MSCPARRFCGPGGGGVKDLLFSPNGSSMADRQKQVPRSGRAARPAKTGLDAFLARPSLGMTLVKFLVHE